MNIRKTAVLATLVAAASPPLSPAVAAPAPAIFEAVPASAFGPPLGDMDGAARLNLILSLPLADAAGAERFVQNSSQPGSATYGQHLTPAQFAARFGASAADYAALTAWAQANGLAVGRGSQARTTLVVTGDVATINRLFATRIGTFRTPSGRTGFAPQVAPALPAALAGKVSGVLGLTDTKSDTAYWRPMNPAVAHPDSGTGVLGGYSPGDLRAIYVVPPPVSPDASQSVALFEQGGFRADDISVFKTHYGLPDIPVVVHGVNGSGTGVVPGVDVEADLDIDMVIGVNPALKQVSVYEDAVDPFPVALVAALTNMADDNAAQTVSISYGFDEAYATKADEAAVRAVALQMAAQGQTLFAATGDSGAYGNQPPALNVSYPSTDPFITAVGGTTLFNFNDVYAGEEAWNLLGLGAGATGGGVSTVFAIPSWQNPGGVSVALANGGSATMRNVPDVAAVGDPQTGLSVFTARTGGWGIIGGTSASTPIWAAFNSLIDGARAGAGLPSLGLANPLFYKLGQPTIFGARDVLDGSNGNAQIYGTPGFNAGPGYDNTTGLGSINVGRYLYSALTQASAKGAKPRPAHGIAVTPAASSVQVSWQPATGATGYLVSVGLAGAGVSNTLINQVTTGSSVVVAGLSPSTPYFLYVTSLNPSGSNSPAAVFFSTTSH